MIGIISQFSVHSPVVSTLGGACFPEVIVFISFHFSKFRCYPWGFTSVQKTVVKTPGSDENFSVAKYKQEPAKPYSKVELNKILFNKI